MTEVLEYTIPVLHPLVVHAPIAFLPAAAIVLLGWLLRDRVRWLVAGLWLQAAGSAGALAAVLSGEIMLEQSEGVPANTFPTWQDAQETVLWAPVSGNAVPAWSNVAPGHAAVPWQDAQSVGKPAATWFGFVVPS